MTQQFIAVGADKYGNRINGISWVWSADKKSGTITSNGLFKASNNVGEYNEAVTVTASVGSLEIKQTCCITIESDFILYDSDKSDISTTRNASSYKNYIIDANGNLVKEHILTAEGYILYGVHGSADGRRLLYLDNVYDDNNELVHQNLWICNTDGSWPIKIPFNLYISAAALSPNGEKIAYMAIPEDSYDSDDWDIWIMDVDGSNAVNLTKNKVYDAFPDWSPDGTKIVYVSTQYSNSQYAPKVCIMSQDGTQSYQISHNTGVEYLPKWSPDGKYIAFESGDIYQTSFRIAVMNSDGTNTSFVTEQSYDAKYPNWSPDSNKIVFCSNKIDAQWDIFSINRDGSNLRRLTDSTGKDMAPVWLMPKQGVEVSTSSVTIHEEFNENVMSTQEVSNKVKDAIIRIESTTYKGTVYGTGFIIRSNGIILTANHVISDSYDINVYLQNGQKLSATVLARDIIHDLALIKVQTNELPVIEISNMTDVDSGKQVVVLGYPLGNKNISVTSGIISSIEFDDGINTTWIQTDSAINPGNSGGPLLNMQGQVIGMVTRFGINTEGIGYAISSTTLNLYVPKLLKIAGI